MEQAGDKVNDAPHLASQELQQQSPEDMERLQVLGRQLTAAAGATQSAWEGIPQVLGEVFQATSVSNLPRAPAWSACATACHATMSCPAALLALPCSKLTHNLAAF